MTSYRLEKHSNRMVADHLTPNLPEATYKQIEGMKAWRERQLDRWRYCRDCTVCIPAADYAAHVETLHPKSEH